MEQPNLNLISTRLKMLSDNFEDFVGEAASGVSGDVVVRAYKHIKAAREVADNLWKAEKFYEVVPKSNNSIQPTAESGG